MMKIETKVDLSTLQKQVAQANKQIEKDLPKITAKGATSYADNALKYVPPKKQGGWSKTIAKKDYTRPIYTIGELLQGHKVRKKFIPLFIEMVKKGMKYAVEGRLHGKQHYWFAKTKGEAKRFTRIFNRGLLKVGFGANLAQDMPKSIEKLLLNSPNLKKLAITVNPVERSKKDKESTIQVINRADGLSDQLTSTALKTGASFAKGTIKKQAQITVHQVIKKWNNGV